MEGRLTPRMRGWLDEDVRTFHRSWRRYLNGLASFAEDVLEDPEAWGPVILRALQERAERQRARLLDHYRVDPDTEDLQASEVRRPKNLAEFDDLFSTFVEYTLIQTTLEVIDTNLARLPADRHALEVCESWLACCYTVPALSMILVEALAESLGARSAQQAASEVKAANLAGYFACKISLNKAKGLKTLLKEEGGSAFLNLLRHLPAEALGVWAEADPLRDRMDDLAKEAAKAIRDHLDAESVTTRKVEPPDKDLRRGKRERRERVEKWEAREEVRSEWQLYLDAKGQANLSEQERRVLDLREAEYSYQEIAKALGIKTTGQVGKVLNDAREKVKAERDRLRHDPA